VAEGRRGVLNPSERLGSGLVPSQLRTLALTDAELRVSTCVARGMTNRSIAEELYLSHHTVDAHLKLDIHSRVELTVLAMQHHSPMG